MPLPFALAAATPYVAAMVFVLTVALLPAPLALLIARFTYLRR